MKEMKTLTDLLTEVIRVIDHDFTIDDSGSCDYGSLYGLARHIEAVQDYLEADYDIPD